MTIYQISKVFEGANTGGIAAYDWPFTVDYRAAKYGLVVDVGFGQGCIGGFGVYGGTGTVVLPDGSTLLSSGDFEAANNNSTYNMLLGAAVWRPQGVTIPDFGTRRGYSPDFSDTTVARLPLANTAGSLITLTPVNVNAASQEFKFSLDLAKLRSLAEQRFMDQRTAYHNSVGYQPEDMFVGGLHNYGTTWGGVHPAPTWDPTLMIYRVCIYAFGEATGLTGGNLAAGKVPQHAAGDNRITFNQQPF